MYCPKCGLTIGDYARNCPKCLSPIPEEYQRTGVPGMQGGNTLPGNGNATYNTGYTPQGAQNQGQKYSYQPQPMPNPGTPHTVSFFYCVGQVFKKYAVFSGRARRKEYWFYALFNFIVGIIFIGFSVLAAASGSEEALAAVGVLNIVYSLVTLLPGLAVSVRRLHDTGRGGAYILLALIPIVGIILLIVYAAQDSQPGDNRYGPNPKIR